MGLVKQVATLSLSLSDVSHKSSNLLPHTKSNLHMNALFLGTFADKEYLPHLKGMFNGKNTYIVTEAISMLTHLELYCKSRNCSFAISTNTQILAKLIELQGHSVQNPSLADYAGSLFVYRGIEIVFISPLKQLFTVPYGSFIARRFISKVVAKETWAEATEFSWTLLDPSNISTAYRDLGDSYAIAADIETFKNPLSIRCIGYTGIFINHLGSISTRSYVLPMDSSFSLTWMRKINALPVPKIFQNGKYDCSYLLRYNAPVTNWYWDTAHLMHSYYSELPKDLAFLNAFFLRRVVYWKDLAETQDLHEYYKYNALDTWATANVWIRQLIELPDWARRNYTLEFPLVYPCLLAEMTGLKRDISKMSAAREEIDAEESGMLTSLCKILGAPAFNPGSPTQVVDLLKLLGCGDITSSSAIDIAKAKVRHPLNHRILSLVSTKKDEDATSIRGLRKVRSTYLRTDDDAVSSGIHKGEKGAKEFRGRILYALNPHGTDTGRLASREHHFWTGLQIQNIPVGPTVKQTICSDDGFNLGECDLEQAESRDTGYISGDVRLIAAVTGSRDFHSVNAAAFFARTYESIYDDSTKKTKDKKLRDLSKRTNHGANYNMGPGVLVDTMGLDKIFEAGRLLGLTGYSAIQIATHLLDQFHRTYPDIKGKYYVSVINEIGISRKLTSRAYHFTEYNQRTYDARQYIEEGDWTRYCFGKPDKNKSDLNSYVAHCPQSLNARTLNEAFMRVFYEIALPNPLTFRLHAQIHDSILFSYAEGWVSHADSVKKCMEIPCSVRDVSGTYRTFTVPAALKLGIGKGTDFKPAKYWSEIE